MDFDYGDEVRQLQDCVGTFMKRHVLPANNEWLRTSESGRFPLDLVERLKAQARSEGLWNLFLPGLRDDEPGTRLTNLQYAPLAEIMGRVPWSPEVFNCNAPDTGNMELLHLFATPEQRQLWLQPLLDGEIRSAFAMTEPLVASSDATNIESSIKRDGDDYVINGRKWFTTGASDPRCQIMIFMGKSDFDAPDRHKQQSMILVPFDTPGVRVLRPLPIFGFNGTLDKASEVLFENVRVPATNILLGEGRGFEIAQGRLGPGRIHHCMRLIGLAERMLERMCRRADLRTPFGRPLSEQTTTLERIAESRLLIDQARLLTLRAAWAMDAKGAKGALAEIGMIKIVAPNMACQVIDWAIQAFGGAGVTNDFGLSAAYATARFLRLADGPDEVHRNQLAKLELRRYRNTDPARTGGDAQPLQLAEVDRQGQVALARYRNQAAAAKPVPS